jgi:hypothetical protein
MFVCFYFCFHLKKKDRFEEMTKEGCGRVFVYKWAEIIHSYSIECGFHQANQLNDLPDAINQEIEFSSTLNPKYV